MKSGVNKNIAKNETIKPPIVPAARGNQNSSLYSPIRNGIKPNIVEITVRKMGRTLAFHALR